MKVIMKTYALQYLVTLLKFLLTLGIFWVIVYLFDGKVTSESMLSTVAYTTLFMLLFKETKDEWDD